MELAIRRVLVASIAVVALFVLVGGRLAAEEIDITVSPHVINIASASTVVTVHTDIAYSAVDGASVKLNGLDIAWWKSDSRGYFVAKFMASAVKGIVDAGTTATLTLVGEKESGGSFSGSDTVEVIDKKKEK
jgi:hypothetical protein